MNCSTHASAHSSRPKSKTCPMCGADSFAPSWLGSTFYRGKEFPYVTCHGCQSLYCHPMPDDTDLEAMYGTSYRPGLDADDPNDIADPKDPTWVVRWLDEKPSGTFMDFGCGRGELLVEAEKKGWAAVGVELNDDVVARTRERTGLPVVTADEVLEGGARADVLHVGDVLEHLTNLDEQLPRILSLVKDGGLLLAQGPLEANDNLFTWGIRLARTIRKRRPVEAPPYHVILATARGQWALFRRAGLEAVEERVTEVSWPAPDRLSSESFLDARAVALFALRRVSCGLSRLRPSHWGNRYRYAGIVRGK